MALAPPTRQQATAWCASLFVVAVIGTAIVFRWKYSSVGLLLGLPLNAALFVCASRMGQRANFDEIRRGIGPGLQTLVGPAPAWALASLALIVLIQIAIGWGWGFSLPVRFLILGLSFFPLSLGIIAGNKWALQFGPPEDKIKFKSRKVDEPTIDIWKP